MTPSAAESVDIFFGDMTEHRAHIYVRLPLCESTADVSLRGSVTGPHSQLTRTLAATIPIQHLDPGPQPLGRATVPDPCFWSPNAPYLYDVRVELWRDGERLNIVQRQIGLRMMRILQGTLTLSGEPWTLFGIDGDASPGSDEVQHPEGGIAVVRDPSDKFCQHASETGLPLAIWLSGSADNLEDQIRHIARWPAVFMALIRQRPSLTFNPHSVAPNLLFAEHLPANGATIPADWADIAVVDIAPKQPVTAELQQLPIPLLARVPWPDATTAPVSLFDECLESLRKQFGGGASLAGCLVKQGSSHLADKQETEPGE
jgi:hypothetical protein